MVVLRMSAEASSRIKVLMHEVFGSHNCYRSCRDHEYQPPSRASDLVSRPRGRARRHRPDKVIRVRVISVVWTLYHNFGPTLASEYLS